MDTTCPSQIIRDYIILISGLEPGQHLPDNQIVITLYDNNDVIEGTNHAET